VLSLLIFGSATLQDFAFAMMIGIASGTYSSIFIASPVLTAWKEREPQYIRRRQRIAEVENGLVPAFADDVQVARLATDDEPEEEVAPEELERATTSKRKRLGGGVATVEPSGNGSGADTAVVAPEPAAAPQAPSAPANADPAPAADVPSDADPESAERRKRNDERRAKRTQRRKGGRRR
jgi:SecD/SecF fusion protein